MVLVVREVVVRPAQRSSHVSHGRQRMEMEAQDWGDAVGSLRKPLWRTGAKVEICLSMMFRICSLFATQGVRIEFNEGLCSRWKLQELFVVVRQGVERGMT
jgi:hypothetical protein